MFLPTERSYRDEECHATVNITYLIRSICRQILKAPTTLVAQLTLHWYFCKLPNLFGDIGSWLWKGKLKCLPSSLLLFFDDGFRFRRFQIFGNEIGGKEPLSAMVAAFPPICVTVVSYYHWKQKIPDKLLSISV